MSTPTNSLSYRDAGVDIDAGDQLVENIKPYAKRTMRPEVLSGIGGFGGLVEISKKYKEPVLVSGTDGVGTKLKLAFELNRHDTVGIDLVAMSVNDILVQGAEPLFFLDYFACGKLDVPAATEVIKGIAAGCEQSGCALIGGETAEMPGMYDAGDYDLAGFAVGALERGQALPRGDIASGDAILGIASSGLHSNGFSLVRHLIKAANISLTDPAPFTAEHDLGLTLLTPTKLYVKSGLAAIRQGGVKALAHITGGGLTENLPRVLPKGLMAEVDLASWTLPPLFAWLQRSGNISEAEMLKTFNCGIGMVAVVAREQAEEVMTLLAAQGETVFPIGRLVAGSGEARVVYSSHLAAG